MLQKRIAESYQYIAIGENYMENGWFVDAKNNYEKALQLFPSERECKEMGFNDDETKEFIAANIEGINMSIANATDSISAQQLRKVEQERQRWEAKEKARREAEEAQVRAIVDQKAKLAIEDIGQGCLQIAANKLKHALDTAKAHNYEYRKAELTLLIDSIHHIQAQIADKSKVFEYKTFRPDLYEITNRALERRIKNYLKDRDKPICNHVTLTMTTNNQLNSFQLAESSRPLRKFCSEELVSERLMPLIIDSQPLNARATYNYDIEYAKGTAKVWLGDNNKMKVYSKYDISPQLESDLKGVFHSKIVALPSSCKGTYKFTVTSMNVGGQMEHDIKLKSMRVQNGPQNAWRSVLVPGWGNKYVDDKGEFQWLTTILSYGLTGYGLLSLYSPNYRKSASVGSLIVGGVGSVAIISTSLTLDKTDSRWPILLMGVPFYALTGVGLYSAYTIQANTFDENLTAVPWTLISAGTAIWAANVLLVWMKGDTNKKDCKKGLGQLTLTYDAKNDAPELVYSLRF